MSKGWHNESKRHSLSARGISTNKGEKTEIHPLEKSAREYWMTSEKNPEFLDTDYSSPGNEFVTEFLVAFSQVRNIFIIASVSS